ncbi:hypothetical protein J5N97_017650 [Dioscorea zingiberensis]|uniref:Uncharacterized protein n=1 Tax=Dioscorea zingiberensis TaxID=325984 RepID=A0A9D5CPI3_9LILI|nr:hypothetical protein J5N97_017650 [Dioscorea zingiberensis]
MAQSRSLEFAQQPESAAEAQILNKILLLFFTVARLISAMVDFIPSYSIALWLFFSLLLCFNFPLFITLLSFCIIFIFVIVFVNRLIWIDLLLISMSGEKLLLALGTHGGS